MSSLEPSSHAFRRADRACALAPCFIDYPPAQSAEHLDAVLRDRLVNEEVHGMAQVDDALHTGQGEVLAQRHAQAVRVHADRLRLVGEAPDDLREAANGYEVD